MTVFLEPSPKALKNYEDAKASWEAAMEGVNPESIRCKLNMNQIWKLVEWDVDSKFAEAKKKLGAKPKQDVYALLNFKDGKLCYRYFIGRLR